MSSVLVARPTVYVPTVYVYKATTSPPLPLHSYLFLTYKGYHIVGGRIVYVRLVFSLGRFIF